MARESLPTPDSPAAKDDGVRKDSMSVQSDVDLDGFDVTCSAARSHTRQLLVDQPHQPHELHPYPPFAEISQQSPLNRGRIHNMQDPSYGVPAPLLPHVHLVSDFRLPITHTMSLDMVVEYLMQAPKIVREVHPMSWTYFSNPPPDGQSFLLWQPQRQQQRMSSDGYVWADPETQFQQEVKGYTVEILIHRSGYRFGEQFTAHGRQRFRLIGKNPASPGPNPDPSLWIVHYSTADPQNRHAVQRIPTPPETMRQMKERQMLEQQGQLARRPFMLHDRQNWPQINFTPAGAMHGQAGGMFPGQMHSGMNRNQAQQFYQQSGMMGQGPPSKRLRQTGPAQLPGAAIPGMPPAMSGMPHDPFVEEEESVALGDALDHLTPREISIVRYTQHHEWMEEIFSSAYPAHQIAAVDLGLGLAGELAEITRGILDAPDDKFVIEEAKTRERGYDKAADAKGPEPKELGKSYQRLSTAQQEEFDKRIGAFIEKGEDELEKMRAEHAKTMAELRRGKTYMKAERQLKDALNASRDLPSDDQDGADPIDADPIDAVVKGVENSLAVSVGPRRDVVCVTKGGLVEEEAKPEPEQEQAQEANGTKDEAANGTNDAYNGNGLSNGGMEDTNIGEAAGLLDQFGNSTSFNNTPGANLSTPHLSNPTSHAQSATGTPGVARSDQNQTPGFPDQEGMEAGGEGDAGDGLDLIEGMDLDMPDIPDMSEDAVDEHATGGDDWVMVDDATGGAADQIEDAAVSQANNSAADIPAPIDLPAAEDSAAPGVSDDLPPAAGEAATGLAPQITTASTGADPAPATSNTTPGLYDTGHDFEAEFTHVDSAGDALADFGGGGDGMEDLGLEDSMFGEAIQGLDGADDPDDAGLGDLGAHAEDAALGDMRGVAEDAGDLGAGVIAGAGKEIGVAEGLEETVHPRSAGESGGGAGGTEVAGVTEVGAAAEAGDDAA